jgi:protein-tyrosine phosphatase
MRDQIRPADLDRLTEILQGGGIAIIPTDTVYGLIGKAFDADVFKKLDMVKGERRLPYATAFESLESIEDWFGGLGFRARRMAHSLLPGPITLVMNSAGKIPLRFRHRSAGIGVRLSTDKLLPELSQRLNSPIWATSANRSGDTTPGDFRTINPGLIQQVDFAIDAGPTTFHDASTVIDLRENEYKIVRKGPWANRAEASLQRSGQPLQVLLLCSGNICRSPIAAFLLQHELGPVETSLVSVSSAGLDALPQLPATKEMVDIAAGWGIDLSTHEARQATLDLLRQADIILTATPRHHSRVIQMEPKATRKTFLMGDSVGVESITDPYQLGAAAYQESAELIRRAMKGWAERIKRIVSEEFGTAASKANG